MEAKKPKRARASFAKIVRPTFPAPLLRPRLFRLLDSRAAQVAWVSGPPGSGKTVLASTFVEARRLRTVWYRLDQTDADASSLFHYLSLAVQGAAPSRRTRLPALTIDRMAALDVFARQFFVQAYARLKPPFVLVFDNVQDLPQPSVFDLVLRSAALELPAGGRILVLSRGEPPPELARLQAERRLALVSWPELRLTAAETASIARRWRVGTSAPKLHEASGGWAAGLELLLQRTELDASRRTESPRLADERALFDYFAGEIFAHADESTKHVLMTSALLPEMPEAALVELSGISEAPRILARLSQSHYFTERGSGTESTFVFHPLFRDFLLAQGERAISTPELSRLRERAAELLIEHGRVDQAALLLQQARSYGGLIRLIATQAPSLLTSGRWQTLVSWIDSVPAEVRTQTPWLLFWQATCVATFRPSDARQLFALALQGFRAAGDPSGSFLAWAGAVETFFYEWSDCHPLDDWIALLETLEGEYPDYPSPELAARVAGAMMTALKFRKPDHEQLPSWVERTERLLPQVASVESRLVIGGSLAHYHVVTWNVRRGALVLDSLRSLARAAGASPLSRLLWCQMEGAYHCFAGRPEACLQAVREGLELSRESGVSALDFHLLVNGALASLATCDLQASRQYLERMAFVLATTRRVDISLFHMLAACDALYRGDQRTALEHGRQAVTEADASGANFIQPSNQLYLALAMFAVGERERAQALVDEAGLAGHAMRAPLSECMAELARAWFALSSGDSAAARPLLARGFGLARANAYSSIPFWPPDSMAALCAAALAAEVEPEYVREVIRVRGLQPPSGVQQLESWPWPLRILSFGGLRLLRQGEAVRFGRKTQRRALELLGALVAFGAGGVSDERLVSALWPESNDAQGALNTALHRLRRLLGGARYVVRESGVVRLDSCWVDAWALDELLESIKRELHSAPASVRVDSSLERLAHLYSGSLLDGERESPWLLGARERLRDKLLRRLGDLGLHSERTGDLAGAVACHEHAVAIDGLNEEAYRRLIVCHRRLGQDAEARRVLKRCSDRLSAELGTPVSAATLAALSSPP